MLAAQLERVRALERRLGRIIPWLFPDLVATGRLLGQRLIKMLKLWHAACRRAGVPARIPHDFSTTSGGRPCGTSSAGGSRGRSR
jgi:hypothetical protein